MTTATATHCSANSSGRASTDWGEAHLPCNTTRGLRSMIDARGEVRRFCGALGHRENVERRFGRLSEATRVALAIERISRDFDEERNPEGDPSLNGAWR
jgi:hypothetical protein